MRKAAAGRSGSDKEGSGRRYWVRAPAPVGDESAPAPIPFGDAGPARIKPSRGPARKPVRRGAKKTRFLEPCRLAEPRREALLVLLETAGVGDREGRALFAAAVEYAIAEYREAVPAAQPVAERAPPDTGPPRGALAEAADGPAPGASAAPLPVPSDAPERGALLSQGSKATGTPAGRNRLSRQDTDAAGAPPVFEPILSAGKGRTAAQLADLARELAGRLADLDAPTRSVLGAVLSAGDRFGRGYGSGYFEALVRELECLAEARGGGGGGRRGGGRGRGKTGGGRRLPTDPPPAPAPPPEGGLEAPGTLPVAAPVSAPAVPPVLPEPPLAPPARRFVCRVARVFEDCLEAPVSVVPHTPFLAVLGLVATEAGIRLPRDPADLDPVLAEGLDSGLP